MPRLYTDNTKRLMYCLGNSFDISVICGEYFLAPISRTDSTTLYRELFRHYTRQPEQDPQPDQQEINCIVSLFYLLLMPFISPVMHFCL